MRASARLTEARHTRSWRRVSRMCAAPQGDDTEPEVLAQATPGSAASQARAVW